MPSANHASASRAARRIQLQQAPELLDEIIQRPLITAIVALDDPAIRARPNVLALVMLDLKKALAKTASLHNKQTHFARVLIKELNAAIDPLAISPPWLWPRTRSAVSSRTSRSAMRVRPVRLRSCSVHPVTPDALSSFLLSLVKEEMG